MSYGSSSYGSAAISGSAASQWHVFLAYLLRGTGTYEAEAELALSATYFSLFLQKTSEETDVLIEAFSYNDPDETPQSQGTFAGLYAQHVIGAARFIRIVATVGVAGDHFVVRGRPGD